MKKKSIFLIVNKLYFFDYVKDDSIYLIYNDKNKIVSFFRKVCSRLFPNFLFVFFGKWKNILNDVDNVILMDNAFNSKISKYIKKKKHNIKITMYYWNVVNERNKFILEDKNIDSFWTFDEFDSKKYNMKFSPQFYYPYPFNDHSDIKYDVCFLGAAKDREQIILDIENTLKNSGLRTNIIISHSGSNFISYHNYLTMIFESKSVLDVVGDNQIGITLRCLESIFYKKKLITNNKNIINYDFYEKNNVFIIGKDDVNDLKTFLETKYIDISEKIKNKYSYEQWRKNMEEEEKE